jgi:hypothetical protein
MIKDHKKLFDKGHDYKTYMRPLESAKQEIFKKYGEWVDITSPLGDEFFIDLDPCKSYPIYTEDSGGVSYIYPKVFFFPKKL